MKAEVKIPQGFRRTRQNENFRPGDYAMLGTIQAGAGIVWSEWDERIAYINPAKVVCIRPLARPQKKKPTTPRRPAK